MFKRHKTGPARKHQLAGPLTSWGAWATAAGVENWVQVLLNDPKFPATFTALATVSIQGDNGVNAQAPLGLAIADMDGDGNPDVVTANHNSTDGQSSVSILLNDGQGIFTLAALLEVGRNPRAVVLVDLNHDGATDIITASDHSSNPESNISVLLSNP